MRPLSLVVLPLALLLPPCTVLRADFAPPTDANVINVRDYGARGDGVTDDTAALRQAIRAGIEKSPSRYGAGNPGAIGIDFCASNRGTVEDVTIRAPQGSGRTGLSLEKWWPGPVLVKRVRIEGFDRGIAAAQHQCGMTFEHLTLIGQRQVGIRNAQNVLSFRDLVSHNAAPLIDAVSDLGLITVLDGTFSGGAADQPAIRSAAKLYLRGLASTGYGSVVDDTSAADQDVAGDAQTTVTVAEYVSGSPLSLFDGAARALHLPIKETPEYTAAADQWVSGRPDLQAAIDSGKTVVYLPNGHYPLEKTLVIRGAVRRIIGLAASIGPATTDRRIDPLIRFEGCGGDSVTLEHLRINGRIDHASSKALALRHCDHLGLSTGASGATFIEDVTGKDYRIAAGHRLWARQLNAELG